MMRIVRNLMLVLGVVGLIASTAVGAPVTFEAPILHDARVDMDGDNSDTRGDLAQLHLQSSGGAWSFANPILFAVQFDTSTVLGMPASDITNVSLRVKVWRSGGNDPGRYSIWGFTDDTWTDETGGNMISDATITAGMTTGYASSGDIAGTGSLDTTYDLTSYYKNEVTDGKLSIIVRPGDTTGGYKMNGYAYGEESGYGRAHEVYLDLTYIPEPATMLVLGVGAVMVLLRRRR